jgi:hypothetical protein
LQDDNTSAGVSVSHVFTERDPLVVLTQSFME